MSIHIYLNLFKALSFECNAFEILKMHLVSKLKMVSPFIKYLPTLAPLQVKGSLIAEKKQPCKKLHIKIMHASHVLEFVIVFSCLYKINILFLSHIKLFILLYVKTLV